MRALILTATGIGWCEVNALPMPDVWDLLGYWREHPPVHLLMFDAWFERKKPSALPPEFIRSGPKKKPPEKVKEALRRARKERDVR